jgi:transcriptional regulator with XRE-family HTH domain
VNLKSLVHRELGEGLTEEELAGSVGVSVRTIADILADEIPEDPAIWETFARYFRIHADFLRSVVHHTQRDCSTSQRAPIVPPSAR